MQVPRQHPGQLGQGLQEQELGIVFFFFWLFWVFHCCSWDFSSGKWGLISSCSTWAFLCRGFSWFGTQALGCMGSVVSVRRLQSTGSEVVAHRLSCSTVCGIFPDQGLNLCLLNCKQILSHWATKEVRYWGF